MKKLALTDEILLKIDKPARYLGNEINAVMKDRDAVDVRFAMCFPDVYEIGMSHLGIQILYDMFNQREDVWCERVYSPWTDLDKIMREQHIPLFALESQDPIREFDFLGITLQYEMAYTNVLQILDLSQIPLYAKDRTWDDPIVIGGGPCAYNPEPLANTSVREKPPILPFWTRSRLPKRQERAVYSSWSVRRKSRESMCLRSMM